MGSVIPGGLEFPRLLDGRQLADAEETEEGCGDRGGDDHDQKRGLAPGQDAGDQDSGAWRAPSSFNDCLLYRQARAS